MAFRFFCAAVGIFWVTMNVLLWRAEYGAGRELGSPVPVAVVWRKILNAPDDSALVVQHRGQRVGFCRWIANVGETPTSKRPPNPVDDLEGRVREPAGFTIDVEGSALVAEVSQRLRLSLHAQFAPDDAWRTFELIVGLRPATVEIRGSAPGQIIELKTEVAGQRWQRRFTFAELRQPGALLAELGGPWAAGMPALAGLPDPARLSAGLVWQAHHDTLRVGRTDVRAYRLHAKLLDRHQAVVYVSRAGEILRVELPGEVVLMNDALSSL
jgi:hypothetical protein